MSKNIVDAVLDLKSTEFGLLPTRRQIDYNGGYVNNWTTETFFNYIRNKSKEIILQRDHSGIAQAETNDMMSFFNDSKYFDIIHIDPWKHYVNDFKNGFYYTKNVITGLYDLNNKLLFEIGTEEAINYFNENNIEEMLYFLQRTLSKEYFDSIFYVVVQSGVGLDLMNRVNVGVFDIERLKNMVAILKKYGKKSKEHNGDYLSYDEIKVRFDNGLDSLNIGPELAQIETETYLEYMTEEEIDDFYQICLNSKKWVRWVNKEFDITNKKNLIMICGHYCYNSFNLPEINELVIENIKTKLKNLP